MQNRPFEDEASPIKKVSTHVQEVSTVNFVILYVLSLVACNHLRRHNGISAWLTKTPAVAILAQAILA